MRFKSLMFDSLSYTLVGVNFFLAGAVGFRLWQGTEIDSLLRGEKGEGAPIQRSWLMPDIDVRANILGARQLFGGPRTEAVAVAGPRTAPAPPRENPAIQNRPAPTYRLVGTLMVPGGRGIALIEDESNERITVTRGDDVDGWTVGTVEHGRAILGQGVQEIEIGMEQEQEHQVDGSAAMAEGSLDAERSAGTRQLAGNGGEQREAVADTSSRSRRRYRAPLSQD